MKYRMKNSLTGVITIIVALISLTSCEDFLDVKQGDQIIPENHFKNSKEMDNMIWGAVTHVQELIPEMIITTELLGDLATVTDNADADLIDINLHRPSVDNNYIDASGFYKVIITMNECLKYLPSLKEKELYFDEYEYQTYLDYIIAFRSWAYLSLVRLYGEAAYIPDNMETLPDNLDDLQILTREVMLDTLINQHYNRIFGGNAYSRWLSASFAEKTNLTHLISLFALTGEIMLERELYSDAAIILEYSLYGPSLSTAYLPYVTPVTGQDGWKGLFIGAEGYGNDEYYFVVPYSQTNNQENPLYNWTSVREDYLVKPTSVIADLYEKNEDTKRGWGASIKKIDNNMVINKYLLDSALAASSDIIVYRAADIQLMLAEAFNRSDQRSKALELINSFTNTGYTKTWPKAKGIRGRVSLPSVSVPEGSDSITVIEDFIMEERAMELAYEGKRWFDLMRVAHRRGNNAYLADKVAAKFEDQATADQVRALLMNEKNWYLPYNK